MALIAGPKALIWLHNLNSELNVPRDQLKMLIPV